MKKILLTEYAKNNGISPTTARHKALAGGYKTAEKIGRDWFINSNEPHLDRRVKSGEYVDWRIKHSRRPTELPDPSPTTEPSVLQDPPVTTEPQ